MCSHLVPACLVTPAEEAQVQAPTSGPSHVHWWRRCCDHIWFESALPHLPKKPECRCPLAGLSCRGRWPGPSATTKAMLLATSGWHRCVSLTCTHVVYVNITAGNWVIVRTITSLIKHLHKNQLEMGLVIVGVIVLF